MFVSVARLSSIARLRTNCEQSNNACNLLVKLNWLRSSTVMRSAIFSPLENDLASMTNFMSKSQSKCAAESSPNSCFKVSNITNHVWQAWITTSWACPTFHAHHLNLEPRLVAELQAKIKVWYSAKKTESDTWGSGSWILFLNFLLVEARWAMQFRQNKQIFLYRGWLHKWEWYRREEHIWSHLSWREFQMWAPLK